MGTMKIFSSLSLSVVSLSMALGCSGTDGTLATTTATAKAPSPEASSNPTLPSAESSSEKAGSASPAPSVTLSPHDTPPLQPMLPASFIGTWRHLQEKQDREVEVYVNHTSELPPTRFRKQFTLEAGGVARVLCLAPNDAHQAKKGSWKLEKDTLTIEVQCFGPKPTLEVFRVEKITVADMTLRPVR